MAIARDVGRGRTGFEAQKHQRRRGMFRVLYGLSGAGAEVPSTSESCCWRQSVLPPAVLVLSALSARAIRSPETDDSASAIEGFSYFARRTRVRAQQLHPRQPDASQHTLPHWNRRMHTSLAMAAILLACRETGQTCEGRRAASWNSGPSKHVLPITCAGPASGQLQVPSFRRYGRTPGCFGSGNGVGTGQCSGFGASDVLECC